MNQAAAVWSSAGWTQQPSWGGLSNSSGPHCMHRQRYYLCLQTDDNLELSNNQVSWSILTNCLIWGFLWDQSRISKILFFHLCIFPTILIILAVFVPWLSACTVSTASLLANFKAEVWTWVCFSLETTEGATADAFRNDWATLWVHGSREGSREDPQKPHRLPGQTTLQELLLEDLLNLPAAGESTWVYTVLPC